MADYINRKAVRNELYDADAITMKGVAILNNFPAADVMEVVHGRWIRKPHDGNFGVFHLWHCSECDTIRARQDPYCGECGAKMDGDKNG